MTTIVPLDDNFSTAPLLLRSGDSLFVMAGLRVTNIGTQPAVTHAGVLPVQAVDDVRITVNGTLSALGDTAIMLTSSQNTNLNILVGEGGTIAGKNAALFVGGTASTIENHGQIVSDGFTVMLSQFNATAPTAPSAVPDMTILNHGTIFGFGGLFLKSNDNSGTLRVVNTGTIQGERAIDFSDDVTFDTVVNTGRIIGTVDLGGSADRFDNRGGRVDGAVTLGEGNDTYVAGGAGVEVVEGGQGTDVLDLRHLGGATLSIFGNGDNAGSVAGDTFTGFEVILGSNSGADRISGLPGDVRIDGNGGNDSLSGLDGNDTLNGGAGNDRLEGGAGANRLAGGAGNDLYIVSHSGSTIVEAAGAGTDTVRTAVSLTLAANVENGQISTAAARSLTGNALANTLTGNAGADTLNGGAGNDRLDGAGGADLMLGGAGNDTYVVNTAADQVVEAANGGIDLVLTAVSLTLAAEVENARVTGTGGRAVTGNALGNRIEGGAGDDRLSGLSGRDHLLGGAGRDALNGGTGRDRLEGGAGDDLLTGGRGRDALTGGAGDDDFVFLSRAEGRDRIADFTQGEDQIVIRAAGFGGGLVAGDLDADLFVTGTTNRAQDAEDRFIFRTTDATLWFDANGSARGGRVLVADLQDSAVLDAGDIVLV